MIEPKVEVKETGPMFNPGTPVWLAIGGIRVPGVITDSEAIDRPIARTNGTQYPGRFVEVISFRNPPGRDAYYTAQYESVTFLGPRRERYAFVDGPDGIAADQLLVALRERVNESALALQRRRLARALTQTNYAEVTAPAIGLPVA